MKILALLALLLTGASGGLLPGRVASVHSGAAPPRPQPRTASASMWRWPLAAAGGSPPQVVRPFEPPAQRWLRGHRGADLAAPGATRVLAAGPGTVAFAGTLFGQGVVVVSHGALRTSYEPVTPSVHVGDTVTAGAPIGTLAAGHCPSAACLHWGLLTGHRHGVRYYDPLLLLGLAHLRLEPLWASTERPP